VLSHPWAANFAGDRKPLHRHAMDDAERAFVTRSRAAIPSTGGVVPLNAGAGVADSESGGSAGTASQQLCESFGGAYSTKASSSFFRPFYKKQGVMWTCNGYGGGSTSTSTQALDQSCKTDGGQWTDSSDAGLLTCWKHPPV
jgi:hypothetical protein